MRTTIDSAGRIVVPKAVRDALQLSGGQEIDLSFSDGRITIEVPASAMHLADSGQGLAAVPDEPLPPLTVDQVRETLDQVRR